MIFLVQIKFISEDSEQTHIQILILNKNYFNRTVYTTEKKNKLSTAWLGLMETGSILITEKSKHLSKMSDRVSQMFWSASTQGLKVERIHRSIYR